MFGFSSRMGKRGFSITILIARAAVIMPESQSLTASNYRSILSRETPSIVMVPFFLANRSFGVLNKSKRGRWFDHRLPGSDGLGHRKHT